jgi:hypothetical protein
VLKILTSPRGIMMLEPELEKYYNNYLDLFMTEGWTQFEEDTNNIIESIKLLNLEDAKALHKAQGQLQILNWVIAWKGSVRSSLDTLKAEPIEVVEEDFE